MRRRRAGGEQGTALVEFSWLAILLMVPLVYLVLSVFEVQRAAYAVTAASREAGRAYVTTTSGDPQVRAVAAARLVAKDQGVELTAGDVRVTCAQQPCLQPGGSVRVRVDTQVGLPFLPDVLFGQVPASVAVHGRHVEVVDTYRDVPRNGAGPP